MCAERSWPQLACIALLAALGCVPGWAQQARAPSPLPDFAGQSRLPIDLEASSSEVDRRSERLLFQDIHITQGTLSIRADHAEAARLDFENSRWTFRGNVQIFDQGARIWCTDAELNFLGHELRTALLHGSPARFEQRVQDKHTQGRAGALDYDVTGGRIRMSANAWVSDGANEITGEQLTYDMGRQHVTAESGSGGPVRMKISPQQAGRQGGAAP